MSETVAIPKTRLTSLTGLRFFAALLVFGYHALHFGGADGSGLGVFAAGMSGVSFFYIVSGFVLAWSARDADKPQDFYRRRFARIYPSYLAVWAATSALSMLSGNTPSLVDLAPLTLLQSWVPLDFVYFATSAVFWSLSCEAFFYLAFPFVFAFLRNLSTQRIVGALAACILCVFFIAALVGPIFNSAMMFWVVTIFPPVRMLEFLGGVLVAILMRRGLRSPVPLWAASVVALGAFVLAPLAPESFVRVAVTLLPFLLLVCSAATADIQDVRSIYRSKPLQHLGNWSYGFYLLHTQVMAAFFLALGMLGVSTAGLSGLGLWAAHAGAFAAATVAAAILFRLIEAPMERLLRPQRGVVDADH